MEKRLVALLLVVFCGPVAPFSLNRCGWKGYLLGNPRCGRSSIPRRNVRHSAAHSEEDASSSDVPFPHKGDSAKVSQRRFHNLIPGTGEDGFALDKKIIKTAVPSMINLAVVPLVNAVDTFWVGRMGVALAMAGQAAANQAFFTLFFLLNYLPTITAPMVASAVGSGDTAKARKLVCESLFLSNVLGGIGMILLVGFPLQSSLSLVLEKGAPAIDYAVPYLRFRALSIVPALIGATGFAAFRGSLDTVTPLKVSLFTNFFNLILDPLLIFFTPLGVAGAAIATAASETLSGLIYLRLLVRRKLANLREIVRIPSMQSLAPLVIGGATMLGRQAALNVGFVCAARRAQSLDKSGVAAAAYGIVMQLYSIGIVMHVAMQTSAATLVPSIRAQTSNDDAARRIGDRMFTWNTIVGLGLGGAQFLALPWIVPLFSTLPEVQQAIRTPALISSLLLAMNGPVFAGEGIMLGLGCFRDLMLITSGGIACMVACLSLPMAKKSVNGILASFVAFTAFQVLAVSFHYLKIGPLAVRKSSKRQSQVSTT